LLGATFLGVVNALLPIFVVLVPRLGPGPIHHLRRLRRALAAASLAIALATFLRKPAARAWPGILLTGALAGLSDRFDTTSVFVALDRPRHAPGRSPKPRAR